MQIFSCMCEWRKKRLHYIKSIEMNMSNLLGVQLIYMCVCVCVCVYIYIYIYRLLRMMQSKKTQIDKCLTSWRGPKLCTCKSSHICVNGEIWGSITANLRIIDVRYQFSTVFSTSLLVENRSNHDNGRQLFWDWQYIKLFEMNMSNLLGSAGWQLIYICT